MSSAIKANDNLRIFSGKSSEVRLANIVKMFQDSGTGEDFVAVNNVNLTVADGELVTLLGPSGCGKTTTLRMISGFELPSSGSIFIGDEDVANVPPNKRDISMMFQSYALFPHLTVWENIAYGLKVKKLPKREIAEHTYAAMELMQLTGMETRFPSQLSGGQQQRVALARAVVIEPRVLLFDEPLSNLDAKLRERMRDELRAIQKRLGITSIYVTHDQGEAMAISDRVVIMKDGNLVQIGTPRDVYEFPNSKFVAHFIGKANFIPATFQGREGESAIVLLNGQRLLIPNPGDTKDLRFGSACIVAIRPESVGLSAEGDGISGTIIRATYYGSRIEYEVDICLAKLIVEISNPQRSQIFRYGDIVNVLLDLRCIRVLLEDSVTEEYAETQHV